MPVMLRMVQMPCQMPYMRKILMKESMLMQEPHVEIRLLVLGALVK
jgi:hypothetical protein